MSNFGEIKSIIENNPDCVDAKQKLCRVPYGFAGYRPPPRRLTINPDSTKGKMLIAVCKNEIQKEIVKLHFFEGLSVEYVADAVGYSDRQIYRIKKRLLEKMQERLSTNEISFDKHTAEMV